MRRASRRRVRRAARFSNPSLSLSVDWKFVEQAVVECLFFSSPSPFSPSLHFSCSLFLFCSPPLSSSLLEQLSQPRWASSSPSPSTPWSTRRRRSGRRVRKGEEEFRLFFLFDFRFRQSPFFFVSPLSSLLPSLLHPQSRISTPGTWARSPALPYSLRPWGT